MRMEVFPWMLLALVLTGCGSSPGGAGGGGAGGGGGGGEGGGTTEGCTPVHIEISSPAEGAISDSWKATIEGTVTSDAELAELTYSNDQTRHDLPTKRGPFSFDLRANGRPEVRLQVKARTVDGCVAEAELIVQFDTSSTWVELTQGDKWVEVVVATPGEQVKVFWDLPPQDVRLPAFRATEIFGKRVVDLVQQLGPGGPEGTVTLTVENRDLEIWSFEIGVKPGPARLVISVGTSLRMVPERAVVGPGNPHWISLPNAIDAVWTVEPGASLEPVPPQVDVAGYPVGSRAGALFEARHPGTYTVRATSLDGTRMGEATIEVRALEPPPAAIRDLPSFPDGFSARSVEMMHDGTLVAGGGFVGDTPRAALLELAPDAGSWTPLTDLGGLENGAIVRVAIGPSGEVFALHDSEGVLEVSTDGAAERIPYDRWGERITSIYVARGSLFAVIDDHYTFVFDPPDFWWPLELWGCPGLLVASEGDGFWQSCAGIDWLVRLEPDWFMGKALGPISSLALDGEGSLIAATTKGVHRLSADMMAWDSIGGGSPTSETTVLLRAGERLFAGDAHGLWALTLTGESWVRVPGPSLEGWQPFYLARPGGGIVVGDGRPGGAVFEVSLGE